MSSKGRDKDEEDSGRDREILTMPVSLEEKVEVLVKEMEISGSQPNNLRIIRAAVKLSKIPGFCENDEIAASFIKHLTRADAHWLLKRRLITLLRDKRCFRPDVADAIDRLAREDKSFNVECEAKWYGLVLGGDTTFRMSAGTERVAASLMFMFGNMVICLPLGFLAVGPTSAINMLFYIGYSVFGGLIIMNDLVHRYNLYVSLRNNSDRDWDPNWLGVVNKIISVAIFLVFVSIALGVGILWMMKIKG